MAVENSFQNHMTLKQEFITVWLLLPSLNKQYLMESDLIEMIKTYAEILNFGIEMEFSYSSGAEGPGDPGDLGDPGGLWKALKGDQAAFDFDAMGVFVVDSGPDLEVYLVKNLVLFDPHVG